MTQIQVREPLVYAEEAPTSFFQDLVRSKTLHDDRATERLDRHQRQMRVEAPKEEKRLEKTADGTEIEYRVAPNSTTGTGGEFDVPLWLVDRFATAGRAGRPFADLLQPMLLPSGVQSVHTPRMTTGNIANVQNDSGAVASQDVVTTDASSNVVTIAGEGDISQQLLDLSPIGLDAAWYLDLTRAYNKTLEYQLLYGTGTNGQLLGLSNIAGTNSVSGSGANTIATIWPLLGQVAAAVGNNRQLPPEAFLAAPRRWFWIASSVDSSNRPVASPGNSGPHTTDLAPQGGSVPFGPLVGLPTYLDGAIPSGTSADDIFAVRPSDMFLWESAPRYITAQNPLSGSLQMKLSLHRYVAFIGNRYPNGIGKLTALPQPSNF